MAISEWWAGDASERYWVEITQRPDVGVNLWAPTADQSGRPYWGYELVTYTRPGDIVFHWHKHLLGTSALIGWSVVDGPAMDDFEEWQPRGTYGRAGPQQGLRPVWQVPLSGFTMLQDAITESDVRALEPNLRQIIDQLTKSHGEPIYFPFAISDRRPVRAAQTYFTKWPLALNELFGLREAVAGASVPLPDVVATAGQHGPKAKTPIRRSSTGSGYIADAVVRAAIEMHAVQTATTWYKAADFSVEYTGANRPFDLVARKGRVERRVEVKGSSGGAEKVVLTRNEVLNAQDFSPVDLFVVDRITIERQPDGSPIASGGRSRRWAAWVPAGDRLEVTQYRFELGDGAEELT
jgi:hypothetical protein